MSMAVIPAPLGHYPGYQTHVLCLKNEDADLATRGDSVCGWELFQKEGGTDAWNLGSQRPLASTTSRIPRPSAHSTGSPLMCHSAWCIRVSSHYTSYLAYNVSLYLLLPLQVDGIEKLGSLRWRHLI